MVCPPQPEANRRSSSACRFFWAGNCDDQRGADLEQWKGHVLARHLLGQALNRLRIHGVGVDARRVHAELRTQRIEHTFGGGETHLDQHSAQAPPGALLPVHRLRQLLLGDQLPFEENLAEGPCGGKATRASRRCGRRLGRCGAGVSVRWLRVGGGRRCRVDRGEGRLVGPPTPAARLRAVGSVVIHVAFHWGGTRCDRVAALDGLGDLKTTLPIYFVGGNLVTG